MTEKKKNKNNNELSNDNCDALKDDLKHFGYLLPTNEDEEEEFDKIYGSTQVLIPEKFKTPDFLFEDESEKKMSPVRPGTKKVNKENKVKSGTVQPITKNTYFKRLVLSAEIASQLHQEPTFGHIKFVKIQFLCEQIPHMDINTNYGQYAAGPLDPKNIHSVDAEFKKRKWFTVTKKEYGYKYAPAQKLDEYKVYYERYFSDQIENINRIIDLLRKKDSKFCEMVATLFAVWQKRLRNSIPSSFTVDDLYTDFYGWSDAKAKFSTKQLNTVYSWMKENSVVPWGQ